VEALEDKDKRKVDLRDRFVEPIFFEKFRIFGMPDERQVGVKDQAEVPNGHESIK
jgi:hypothetical protein